MSASAADVLASVAGERTHLAWRRTALSWIAAGAAVVRYFADEGVLRPHVVTGALMALVGVVMCVAGRARYRRADAAIARGAEVRVPTVPIGAVRWATVLVAAAAVASVLARVS